MNETVFKVSKKKKIIIILALFTIAMTAMLLISPVFAATTFYPPYADTPYSFVSGSGGGQPIIKTATIAKSGVGSSELEAWGIYSYQCGVECDGMGPTVATSQAVQLSAGTHTFSGVLHLTGNMISLAANQGTELDLMIIVLEGIPIGGSLAWSMVANPTVRTYSVTSGTLTFYGSDSIGIQASYGVSYGGGAYWAMGIEVYSKIWGNDIMGEFGASVDLTQITLSSMTIT